MTTSLQEIPLQKIDGTQAKLADYDGSVLLVVNVASKCGLTPQYEGLQSLYREYRGRGFEVLAFPSNDFGGQEPGTHEEIQEFCSTNYNVEFPLFAKVSTKGSSQHPLYKALIQAQPHVTGKPGSEFKGLLKSHGIEPENDTDVLWNFEKFVIGRDGTVIARFAPDVAPNDKLVTDAIEKSLG